MIQVEKDNREIYLWLLIAVAVFSVIGVAVSKGRQSSEWKDKFKKKEQEYISAQRRMAGLADELAGEKEKNNQWQRLVAEGELKNQALRAELGNYPAVKEQLAEEIFLNQELNAKITRLEAEAAGPGNERIAAPDGISKGKNNK